MRIFCLNIKCLRIADNNWQQIEKIAIEMTFNFTM